MVGSRLFLVRVWPHAQHFRAVLRAVEEESVQLFTAPEPLADYLRGLTASAPQASAVPLTPLTPRELEVALLCEQGLGHKHISKRLGLAPATVRNHISHCYQKLGVSNRLALARALHEASSLHSGGAGAFAPSPQKAPKPSMAAGSTVCLT